MREYFITPVPAPRMVRSDKWAKRPCVLRYFAFRDEVKLNKITIEPYGCHITFHMPMPKSWSKKKKDKMVGKFHQQRPDLDNLEKSILDSIFDEDSHIADLRCTKVWSVDGRIVIVD